MSDLLDVIEVPNVASPDGETMHELWRFSLGQKVVYGMACAMCFTLLCTGLISLSGDCDALLISGQPHAKQDVYRGSCWEKDGWWYGKFFTETRLHDVIGLGFAGLLVWVGYQQVRVYSRQADVMGRQADIYSRQELLMRRQLDLDRPHLCLVVTEHNFRHFLGGTRDGVMSVSRASPPTISYRFTNYGKSPAVLRMMTREFIPLSSVPAAEGATHMDLPDETIIGVGDSTDDFEVAIPEVMVSGDLVAEFRRPGGPRLWFHGLVIYGSLLSPDSVYEESWLWSFNGGSGHAARTSEGGPHRNRHT